MKRYLALLAALLIGGSVFAQDFVIGIVYDAGGKFDRSFNEATWRGAERAQQELEDMGFEVEVVEFEGSPDTAAEGQRRIAQGGAEIVVAPGFLQADAVSAVAQEFPDTAFTLIDSEPPVPGDNLRSITFQDHEGSFLVGYLAGRLTRTGVLGMVGGMDVPLIRNFALGYEEGVHAACPDCEVIHNYVGVTDAAWNDPARGKELAATQHAAGADIIFSPAGGSTLGVIDWANETQCFTPRGETRVTPLDAMLENLPVSDEYAAACGDDQKPVFFIGVDSNQNYLGDTDGNPETLNHGLSSMLKRVDQATYLAIMDVFNGEFSGGHQNLGLEVDAVGYALDEYNSPLIPESVIEELEGIKQAIIDGEITVTNYHDL